MAGPEPFRGDRWPTDPEALIRLQEGIGRLVEGSRRRPPPEPPAVVGGVFLAYERGLPGPGRPGDRAWAAAVAWSVGPRAGPRRILASVVVRGRVPAPYVPGLLAAREGPLLATALERLPVPCDVVLVDATGLDHPRAAGLAVQVGWALDVPTVGVTQRSLVARPRRADLSRPRGTSAPATVAGREVARWVVTRPGARPVLVHPAWRTDARVATAVVLACATGRSRSPEPLRMARAVARSARALDSGGGVWDHEPTRAELAGDRPG